MSAQDRGWGNPDAPGFFLNNIVKVEAGGVNWFVNKGIAFLWKEFITELTVDYGYSLAGGGWDGAYNNRNIFINGRDTGKKSNHAWGLAGDLNAQSNPVSHDGRVHSDLPNNITELANKYGFFWGGNYSATGYRDPMHFEFLRTPREAVELTAKIVASKHKDNPDPKPPSRRKGRFVYARPGETTYRAIAERVYGNREWSDIIKAANKGKPIIEGERIFVPERLSHQPHRIVTARASDTYRTLARRYYGNSRRYPRIKSANAGKHLHRGTKVIIPIK